MQKIDLVLTGGHAATTAIATIQEIKEKYTDWNLYWIGPESAVEGKYVPTQASIVMPKLGVKFIPISTGRLQRRFTRWTIPSLLRIPFGTLQALKIILGVRPKAVVSFGGYASVPVSLAALVFRIPVIIHEQTTAAGLANKIVSKFATKIAIAREESKIYFPEEKVLLVGNPIRKEILAIKPKNKIGKKPVVYITGGSSGSQIMNKVVGLSLSDILKKFEVIHQTGTLDYEYFLHAQASKKNYKVYDFIEMDTIPKVFEKADFIVSRAGANTVAEIMITKRPAIFIPIPWVQNDEQTKNAKLAEDAGIAITIKEEVFSQETLMHGLEFLEMNWKNMINSKDSELVNLDRNAAKKFVEEIKKLVL